METTAENKSISLIEMAVKKFQGFKVIVKTAADYAEAGTALQRIKEVEDKIGEFFDSDIAKANELHKSLTGKKKAMLDPLIRAKGEIKNARIAFSTEQDRLRQVEQDKLDKAARDEEAKKKAALDKKIEKAEAKGDTASVDALQQQKEQVVVLAPQAAPRVEQVAGIAQSRTWKASVTDFKALVEAVAQGKAPLGLLEVNQAALNSLARATKGMETTPGVKYFEEVSERVSGR